MSEISTRCSYIQICHQFRQNTCVSFSTGLDLQRGAQYTFIVRATNRAGLTVNAYFNGFTVDFTPPKLSKAWVEIETNNLLYQSDTSRITVRYQNVIIAFPETTSPS